MKKIIKLVTAITLSLVSGIIITTLFTGCSTDSKQKTNSNSTQTVQVEEKQKVETKTDDTSTYMYQVKTICKNNGLKYEYKNNTIYITVVLNADYNKLDLQNSQTYNQMCQYPVTMIDTVNNFRKAQSNYNMNKRVDIVYHMVDINNLEIITVKNGELVYFRITDE